LNHISLSGLGALPFSEILEIRGPNPQFKP